MNRRKREKERASETMCWQMENNLPITETLSACDVTESLFAFSFSLLSALLASGVMFASSKSIDHGLQPAAVGAQAVVNASTDRERRRSNGRTNGDASRHLCDICLSTLLCLLYIGRVDSGTSVSTSISTSRGPAST